VSIEVTVGVVYLEGPGVTCQWTRIGQLAPGSAPGWR
jgi:hypothetical protein